jgi:hypothetical protein
MNAALASLTAIRNFLLAGHAVFTLVSKKSGARKTFRVSAAEDKNDFWFVGLLTGSDNTSDYKYLGALFIKSVGPDAGALGFKLNKQGWGEEAAKAFAWLLRSIDKGDAQFFDDAEFFHEGRCGKCGRALTTPESITLGLGPICAGRD